MDSGWRLGRDGVGAVLRGQRGKGEQTAVQVTAGYSFPSSAAAKPLVTGAEAGNATRATGAL